MKKYNLPWVNGFFPLCIESENDNDKKILEDLAKSFNVEKYDYLFEEWIDSDGFNQKRKQHYRNIITETEGETGYDIFYDGTKIILLIEE